MSEPCPEIGERWIFTIGGITFDATVTEHRLDGDVLHMNLHGTTPNIGAAEGSTIICPTPQVRKGRAVETYE